MLTTFLTIFAIAIFLFYLTVQVVAFMTGRYADEKILKAKHYLAWLICFCWLLTVYLSK